MKEAPCSGFNNKSFRTEVNFEFSYFEILSYRLKDGFYFGGTDHMKVRFNMLPKTYVEQPQFQKFPSVLRPPV